VHGGAAIFVEALLLMIGAYLLGAVPFGVLLGKLRGVDIRQHGSRNIGATNVGRVLGRKWGYLCLILDVLKGFIPAFVATFSFAHSGADAAALAAWLLVGVAAVLGHVFPVYLGFRGGKGVATTVGVALGIYPYFTIAMSAALIAYAAVRFGTGHVSAGSLALAVVFPAAFYVYTLAAGLPLARFWPLLAVATALGLLIIVRHRSNIARLMRGEEIAVRREADGATEG
jgi:glycerol-3-phosphate acyltransferase PlsY